MGGQSARLTRSYEGGLVDIMDAATGYRPRLLPCRGVFVAINGDGTTLITRDTNRRHLVWRLDRWTPGSWTTISTALLGLATIWLVRRPRSSDPATGSVELDM